MKINKNLKLCCDMFQGSYTLEYKKGIKSFKWLNSKGNLIVINGYHYTNIYKKLKNYINDIGTIKGYALSDLEELENIKEIKKYKEYYKNMEA